MLLSHKDETLNSLRLKIRIPLHQIISYAEIISESPYITHGTELSTCLSEILMTCESVLRDTHPWHFSAEMSEPSEADFQRRFLDQTGKLLASSLRLQSLVQEEQHSQILQDAAKVLAAAKDLDALGSATQGTLAVAAPLAADAPVLTRSLEPPSSEAALPKTQKAKKMAHSGTVLIVDDIEANRDLLSRRLLRDGCEVMMAESGRQALRMARRYNFDLVLLDIMMPGMNGFEVLEEFKQDPNLRHIPIVMITAVDEVESMVRCIELGADDYLMKPFNPVLLRARVEALLERKHLRDEEIRRTRELETALAAVDQQRKQGEQLLLNILPRSVAEELQSFGSVQPRYFEDVTIVFADFASFTVSTEHLPAEELVLILHEYFTAFDNIIGRFGLEKLKTIGDCYMFAGGLPERMPSHPIDSILASMEMIEATNSLAREGRVGWKLRIGVHTGPVIAGVVGIHKFGFDIWGESVNFSSRIESSGSPGKINISHNTYVRVKDFFSCEGRGKIRIKEGREVEMYFVNGISARLLSNQALSPTEAFSARYRTYFRKNPPVLSSVMAENLQRPESAI